MNSQAPVTIRSRPSRAIQTVLLVVALTSGVVAVATALTHTTPLAPLIAMQAPTPSEGTDNHDWDQPPPGP